MMRINYAGAAGTTARHVYLPAGRWYDWHTSEPVGASRYLLTTTPMDRIPIYVRAGAVIPMWLQAPESTAGYRPTAIELHLFVPETDGKHTSLLQEDDGLSFAALGGARYRTTFEVTRSGGRVTLRAQVEGDGYPEFAREAFHLVLHGAAPATVVLDGIETPTRDGRVAIPNAGGAFVAEFDVERPASAFVPPSD